uniref:Reverse transcriptase domain-containing protein n=1 Tax=Tanacetum cinerariifolium TaxID=118510 RepID=A0A6L2LCC5_TANCI|nr:reverse transcriptase domain-containing protein [Tanacetum cinerariifolium]
MRTRSNFYPSNSTANIPRRLNRRRIPNIVEPKIRTIAEIIPMAYRTMKELLQEPTEGYGEAIVISEIVAENFEIKTNLLQLVQANKFHGCENDNPHTHISNFKRMTATLKYRDVPDDAIKLMIFPYSLEDRARIWYEKEPPNSILTWDDLVNKFVNQFFPPSKTTYLKNEISRFTQRFDETFSEAWDRFKELLRACPHHGFSELTQIDTFYNGLTKQDQDSLNAASGGNLLNKTTKEALQIIENKSKNQPSTSGTLPSNTVPNPKDEQNTEEILNKEHSNSSGSTAQIQPPVVPISISKPDVPRTQTKPTILYPSSFADALLLMPKFASTIKSLLANKDKLFDLENVLLNKNCSAMLLEKILEKLGDPIKFLIPCDFPGMNVCHALADLGASINLMPLSIWKKLSFPALTPTRMTLELADRSITHPKGVAEDVFFKVGKFHFPTDFVVVDFEADPRVPLILERSFLRTGHALIDVYGEEITLRVNNECVTFNLDQVMKYSDNSVSQVNVINIAFEEVVHDNPKSSSPTLVSESEFYEDPIVKISPLGESDFFSEEIEDFLNDDSIPMEIENSMFDPKGDMLLIEKLLNEDPLMELDEVAESSDKNLVPILREHEVTSDNESEYNEPINDDSFSAFTTFTNLLFNDKDDFTSNDNESIHNEDVPIKESKVYSNPLFDDDEIYSDELESHCLNVEPLSNHDTLKFDHLEEFSRALMPIHIAEEEQIRKEHAEYIHLMERLITINPCPHPMVNANTIVESLPSSLIPVQDNDSQREEIDIVTDTDELLPPGFENVDLEEEIYVLEELRVDNSIPSSINELFDFDHDDPSFPRPPPEPPDDEFDFELNSGEVISAVMNNIEELVDDECFDLGGEIDIFANVKDDNYFPFTFVIQNFLPYLIYPEVFFFFSPLRVKTLSLTMASPFRAGGISSGWNFHGLLCLSKH